MRKFAAFTALLSIVLLAVLPGIAHAGSGVQLFLDGELLPSDVPATIVNNRTLVPLRVVGEALGAQVIWVSNSEPIVVLKDNDRIEVKIDSQRALLNGHEINLDVAPCIVNDRAMVPFRFIGESLGVTVLWKPSPPSVYITSEAGQLGKAELQKKDQTVSALIFQSTKAMRLDKPVISDDGSQFSVVVRNVQAEAETAAFESGHLRAYTVEPLDKRSVRIQLSLAAGEYLLPQASLSNDGRSLTIAWPLVLKQMAFQSLDGVEELHFALPPEVRPEMTDTTVEIENGATLPGRITENVVNVRSGPSMEHDRIGTVRLGDRVDVLSETTGWYEVRLANSTVGWIADWLVGVETEIEEKVGVNVRQGPGTNHAKLTTLYPRHKITVLKRENGWCLVEYGAGKTGWIADWLVPLASRLTSSTTVPGLRIFFPQVDRVDKSALQIEASQYITAVEWEEHELGVSLVMQLKKPVGQQLTYHEQGWRLTLGTWVEKVALADTERGPRLRVKMDGPSQPRVTYAAAEQAVIMTIPNAALLNTVERQLPGDGACITKIGVEQADTDVRLRVYLTRQLAFHLDKQADSTWELAFASPTLNGKVIAIDPGHGATDPGAMGTQGWNEKDFTHDIANRLRLLLQQAGAKIVMTREIYSSTIKGPDRAKIINQAGADAFISIHINSVTGNPNARGIETWYYPREDNERFALLVQNELRQELGWPNRGIKPSTRLIITRDARTTGALAEIGFLSNREEENLLLQPDIRQRAAQALFRALERYFAD